MSHKLEENIKFFCILGRRARGPKGPDMIFVTSITSRASVKLFSSRVKLSKSNAKNCPFCVICLIKARDIVALHKKVELVCI